MECDVIKPGCGRKRQDINIHKRQTHTRNHLVVEASPIGVRCCGSGILGTPRREWQR